MWFKVKTPWLKCWIKQLANFIGAMKYTLMISKKKKKKRMMTTTESLLLWEFMYLFA